MFSGVDDYPMGTNAIVAVISYTGYDMEDAMIINKMSFERGFCHGQIYKSEFVDLREVGTLRTSFLEVLVCWNLLNKTTFADLLLGVFLKYRKTVCQYD